MPQSAYAAVPADNVLTTGCPLPSETYGLLLIAGYVVLACVVVSVIFFYEKKIF